MSRGVVVSRNLCTWSSWMDILAGEFRFDVVGFCFLSTLFIVDLPWILRGFGNAVWVYCFEMIQGEVVDYCECICH